MTIKMTFEFCSVAELNDYNNRKQKCLNMLKLRSEKKAKTYEERAQDITPSVFPDAQSAEATK